MRKVWRVGGVAAGILLVAVGAEAFEDRFNAASARKQAERKAAGKNTEKDNKALRMPYEELPAAIQSVVDRGTCSSDEYFAIYNTLWRLLRPATAKRNPDAMEGVARALADVEPVAVGPKNKLVLQSRPAETFKLLLDCERARVLPVDEIEKHPSADLFPGAVAPDAKRVTRSLEINTAAAGYVGTGLYAPAGEVVTIRVPDELVGKKARVVIGLHNANLDLARHKSIRRAPRIDRSFDITTNVVRCANAFGGLIYFHIPSPAPEVDLRKADFYGAGEWRPEPRPVEVNVAGAVEAPRFQLGRTDVARWRDEIRHRPAPFAEIGNDQIIFTLPSEFIRDLDRPDEILATWDRVLAADAKLSGAAQPRPNAIRFLIDAHVNWGAAYASYPIVAPYGWVDAILSGKAGWGHVHEIGHLHQQRAWTFYGCGEVTVNLFSLYALEKVYGDTERRKPEKMANTLAEWFGQPKAERTWEGKGHPGKLTCYMQLVNEFGWEPLMEVIHSYRPELDTWNDRKKKTELECSTEFAARLSRQTGRNLFPFFDDWGLPLNLAAAERVRALPVWNPNAR